MPEIGVVMGAEYLEWLKAGAQATGLDLWPSYGVIHHSPHTSHCLREAHRVLKPGGQAPMMIYHHPSATGAMLRLRYGLLRRQSLRQSVFDHRESPGSKSYTQAEALALLDGFKDAEMRVVFSLGDLLRYQPLAFPVAILSISLEAVPQGARAQVWTQVGTVPADYRDQAC